MDNYKRKGGIIMKKFIRQIDKNARLFRDDRNGLVWIEDGTTGMGISIHLKNKEEYI